MLEFSKIAILDAITAPQRGLRNWKWASAKHPLQWLQQLVSLQWLQQLGSLDITLFSVTRRENRMYEWGNLGGEIWNGDYDNQSHHCLADSRSVMDGIIRENDTRHCLGWRITRIISIKWLDLMSGRYVRRSWSALGCQVKFQEKFLL